MKLRFDRVIGILILVATVAMWFDPSNALRYQVFAFFLLAIAMLI